MTRTNLQNESLVLVPASGRNLDLLIRWTLDPQAQGPYKRVPDMTPHQLGDLFLNNEDRWYFLIKDAATGLSLGRFYYRQCRFNHDPGLMDWELNIFPADPKTRDRGYGASTQGLAAEYLLRLPETHSVFAYTFETNRAEQRALEKAGFINHGRLPSSYYKVQLPPEESFLFVREKYPHGDKG